MAKILIVTYSMYGAWFSLQLEEEGHSVDIWLMSHYDDYSIVLNGIIKPPFRAKPDFKKYDLVIFDLTGRPKIAEEVMSLGVPCIGDGDLHSELEDNRLFGIEVMEQCGIGVPFYETFDDLNTAKRFIRKTNKTFVFKPNGGQDQDTATTYVSKSPEDMLLYLDKLSRASKNAEFILQEVVHGTEISTEAWFDGEEFHLISGTLEEKKLMNDNKGPNTGCAGNLEFIYDTMNPPYVFREGLGKTKDFLQQYGFRGYIDLNSIVTDTKLYGLEWTPRFGYDCTSTLFSLFREGVGDFLGAIASGNRPDYELSTVFAAGTRISIPPYPTEIKNHHPEGIPIEGLDDNDCVKNCFLYDCCLDKSDGLITAGVSGFVCVPIQTGGTLQTAFGRMKEMVKKIQIPDAQYRTDLEESITKRYRLLDAQGWLK